MSEHREDRWQEIDAIFAAALEREPPDRASFLTRACGSDTEIRSAVEALLQASCRADSFLETPLVALNNTLWEDAAAEVQAGPEADDPVGQRIGRYRLVREIGRGGMGTVYLAERADGAFEQQVALKLLRRGLDTDDILARFRAERQILASLSHPNIARLLDGGATDEGRPYVVMERVDGRPITEYCAVHRLPVPERLRLFVQVARAVQYAHQRRVVHRDLKPANILVTADGQVRLLDFGIAKLLDPAQPALHTRTGICLLTPEYAAPEQLRAEPVTPATDVYQLGLLLFELLTGTRPSRTGGDLQTPSACVAHLQRAQRTGAVSGSATAKARSTLPPVLPQELRGKLDTITRNALHAEPERRYASAGEMAEDIERHLAAQPIRARRDGLIYRARIYLVRQRAAAIAVLGAAVALLALAGLTLVPQRGAPVHPPVSNTVAVLPFRTGGAEPSLAYLREGMVDLLATKLTGGAGSSAVDPRTVMSAWRQLAGDDGDLPRDSALALAGELDADRVLLGEVVGTPAHLVMSASVFTVPSGELRARATVEGSADSLPALVDRLAAQVLSLEAGEAEHRLATLTSTSLPALRAYLRGRAAFRHAQHEEAMREFSRALDLDSTFALAGIGLVEASGWTAGAGDEGRALRLAWAARDRLSLFDRSYLTAVAGPRYPAPSSAAEILEQWGRVVRAAPSQFEGWYRLGDHLFHHGALLGIPDWQNRAVEYMGRAFAIDSTSAPLVSHLLHLALAANDTVTARRFGRLYFAADAEEEGQYLRWFWAQVRGDTAELNQIRGGLDKLSAPTLIWLEGTAIFDGIGLDDADRAIAILKSRAPPPGFEETMLREIYYTDLNRGRPEAAARTAERLREFQSVPRLHLRLQLLGSMYGDADPAAGEAAARVLAQHVDAPPPGDPSDRAAQSRDLCVLAQWRFWKGEAELATRAIQRLRSPAPGQVPAGAGLAERNANCAILLEAMDATVQRRPEAARLTARADSMMRTGPVLAPEIETTANLALARLHDAQGNRVAALAATRRRGYLEVESSFLLASYLREEARLAALLNDREGAIRAYRHYLALRSDPEPALRGETVQARAELERLLRAR